MIMKSTGGSRPESATTYHDSGGYKEHVCEEIAWRSESRRAGLQRAAILIHCQLISTAATSMDRAEARTEVEIEEEGQS